jgi:DNA-binding XRE family transcriptional regulator
MSTIVDIIFYTIGTFVIVKTTQQLKIGKKLGKKIATIRRTQKITQAQLAYECGLSRQYISYLESGRQSPTIDSLVSISNVLDVSLKQLFDFEN